MRIILTKILLLLLLSFPTEVLALYLEHTYYIEIGFIVSVFLTYILALIATFLKAYKTWVFGNVMLLVTSYIFLKTIGSNLLLTFSQSRIPMLLIVFLLSWLVPQIFGAVWGRILRQSSRVSSENLNI